MVAARPLDESGSHGAILLKKTECFIIAEIKGKGGTQNFLDWPVWLNTMKQ